MGNDGQWGDYLMQIAFTKLYGNDIFVLDKQDGRNCLIYGTLRKDTQLLLNEDGNWYEKRQCKLLYTGTGTHYDLLLEKKEHYNKVNDIVPENLVSLSKVNKNKR